MLLNILTRHAQRLVAHVRCVHLRSGQMMPQRDGNAPAARSYIRDSQSMVAPTPRILQHRLDEELRLLARHQDIRRHDEIKAVELTMPRDVGKRLPLDPTIHQALERLCVLVAKVVVRGSVESRSVDPKRIAEKHLRLDACIGNVGKFKPLVGARPGLPQPHAPKFSRFRACSASTSR